mmetsp:Transcript_10648/g.35245  ORF Transcript_10648/g.35245 Transcript_10648/m.35245 type:complete len:246 (+) Transcript_10648:114-851(+)
MEGLPLGGEGGPELDVLGEGPVVVGADALEVGSVVGEVLVVRGPLALLGLRPLGAGDLEDGVVEEGPRVAVDGGGGELGEGRGEGPDDEPRGGQEVEVRRREPAFVCVLAPVSSDGPGVGSGDTPQGVPFRDLGDVQEVEGQGGGGPPLLQGLHLPSYGVDDVGDAARELRGDEDGRHGLCSSSGISGGDGLGDAGRGVALDVVDGLVLAVADVDSEVVEAVAQAAELPPEDGGEGQRGGVAAVY